MNAILELKVIIDNSSLDEKEKIKRQLDLLSTLPGEQNEAVFNKLLELATYDANAITVFIDQFVKTSVKLLNR